MRTIETTAVVGPDRTITVKLPDDIPPGEVRLWVVLVPPGQVAPAAGSLLNWPAHDVQMVNPHETFRREDLYDADGR